MKPFRAIQYKALFLLVTFSLNTVVGIACSMGVDMGFNAHHHHHSHEVGKHHGHSDADHHEEHDGENSHSHQHEAMAPHHLGTDNNTALFTFQDEENCCKDFVVGFNSVDKQIVKQDNSTQLKITYLSPFILTAFVSEANNARGFVLHQRIPPREIDFSPPDIRVFIQSFQI